jgi:uncharacterized protein
MRITFFLGHPAHYHMFKHAIRILQEHGTDISVVTRNKDILGQLMERSGVPWINLSNRRTKGGALRTAIEMTRREFGLLRHVREFRPDVLVGTSTEITHIGKLTGTPSVVVNEDDSDVVPLFARAAYPFATYILSPEVCRTGKWSKKKIAYQGYQKLAYLHPTRFQADPARVRHLWEGADKYFLIRWVQLNAHHDRGISGLTQEIVEGLISKLSRHGNVYISAERTLPAHLEKYSLPVPVEDIHHALAQADLLVADSQSMCVEAAVLGTPNIRFSGFVGRISVLEELSEYGLTLGIPADRPDLLDAAVESHLGNASLKEQWASRRAAMLKDKIDVTGFMVWLFRDLDANALDFKRHPNLQLQFS